MIKPLDEFEASLYEESAVSSSLHLWHFFAGSILFFALGTLIVVVSQTIAFSSVSQVKYIPLGSLFIFMGAALLSGGLLGVTIAVGTRIADRID